MTMIGEQYLVVDAMNERQLEIVARHGCNRIGFCYANCAEFISVVRSSGATYVLCMVETGQGETGHAIIEINGYHYDITYGNQTVGERFRFIRSFTLDEVVAFAKSHGEHEGNDRMIPPRLDQRGQIVCTLG